METRRGFFAKVFAGVLAAVVALKAGPSWAKKLAIGLDKAPKLKDVGGWMILQVQDKQILFIRDTKDTVRALAPTCTHANCLVAYNPAAKRIDCPCHGSRFDLDGKVLTGPATTPLRRYPASLDATGRVIVTVD